MKKIYFSIIALLILTMGMHACNQPNKSANSTGETADSLETTRIKFDHTFFDFGKLMQGEIVEHTYFFTNTGKADFYIQSVQASCGCTTPDYTRSAVKPGERGKIVVKFNTNGRSGKQSKSISVYGNLPKNYEELSFAAQIEIP